LREAAENDMKRINEAYDVLSDPKKREQYDMLLALYTLSELANASPSNNEPGEKSDSASYDKSSEALMAKAVHSQDKRKRATVSSKLRQKRGKESILGGVKNVSE
jgi:curved DNA-binding protein CbpA